TPTSPARALSRVPQHCWHWLTRRTWSCRGRWWRSPGTVTCRGTARPASACSSSVSPTTSSGAETPTAARHREGLRFPGESSSPHEPAEAAMRSVRQLLSSGLVAVLALGLLIGLPSQAAAAEHHPRPASGSWEVQGRGWGHGIGMSQWGAQGAATQGLGHRKILEFYYPGTT